MIMSVRISGSLLGAALALTVTAMQAAGEDQNSASYAMPGCRAILQKSSDDLFKQGLCVGMIRGIAFVSESLSSAPSLPGNVRQELCTNHPDEVTIAQLIRVVIAHIEARPARMHEDFRDLALEAFRTAWPCK